MHQTRRHHHYSPSSFIESLTADIPISVTNEDVGVLPHPTARSTKDPFVLYVIALFSVPRIGLVLRASILCMVDATKK